MTPLLVLLAILNLEALAAFLWIFFTPSEIGQGVLLWLSPERLMLAVFNLCLLIGLLAATANLLRSRERAGRLLKDLDAILINGRRLAPALIYSAILPMAIAIPAAIILCISPEYDAYRAWAPDTFPLLRSSISEGLPLLAFLALASLEIAAFLVVRYRRVFFTSELWRRDTIVAPLGVLLIALATAFHWLVLIFQLRFFTNIPAWYWTFHVVPFGSGDFWYVLGALVLLALAYRVLILQRRTVIGLVLLMCLGWFLQVGVGLMGGAGITVLRERYFTTYHQAYVVKAAESHQTVLESIRRYDSLYGSNTFTTTKPPGLMAIYIGLEHLVNGYPSGFEDAARYSRFSNVITWLSPLLASSVVVLMWAFARRFMEDPSGLVARTSPFLYVLAPSLALFTFFADQVLYPAVFLLGIWFIVSVIRGASLPWALLLGAVLYVAAFFAFSMLPLYPFAGLFLVLHYWKGQSPRQFRRTLFTGLGIAAGTLIMYMLGVALLNYDFLSHFQRMSSINHNFDFYLRIGQQLPAGPESLAVRLGQVARAAGVNNLDFAAAVGFPVYILFAIQAARRILALGRSRLQPGDVILLAMLLSFLVLNLAGTAQGEVPRLWLFWLPMVVLLAAFEMEPHLRKRPQWLLVLGVAQLITLMLTFHFQDLRM